MKKVSNPNKESQLNPADAQSINNKKASSKKDVLQNPSIEHKAKKGDSSKRKPHKKNASHANGANNDNRRDSINGLAAGENVGVQLGVDVANNVEFLNASRETQSYGLDSSRSEQEVYELQKQTIAQGSQNPENGALGDLDSVGQSRNDVCIGQIKRRELCPDRKKNPKYVGRQNGYQNFPKHTRNGQQQDSVANFDECVQDKLNEVNLSLPAEERVLEVGFLNSMSIDQLIDYGSKYGVGEIAYLQRQEIIFKILDAKARKGVEIVGEGVLEKLQEGYGFLRSSDFNYLPGPGDIYIAPAYIKRFGLRTGDQVKGTLRKPKDGERYFAMARINSINDFPANQPVRKTIFENLTPVFPNKKFETESVCSIKSIRAMDLFAPIGFGQRGLIVAPPKTGKTVLLKELANSILKNNSGIHMIVLLIDERPEEVTDFRRSVDAEVISSTFDENPARHIQVTEMVLEKAKRMVECGKHVVILLDSLTRLARAYNTMTPSSGKVLSGGVDANALSRPKRFFGAARNIENFGSLTIMASVLIETGSKMDDVIYEEFKGTGNMEVHLTRKLSNKRVYPAFDIQVSGTRRDDLIVPESTLNNMWILQKFLSNMNTVEAMEFLIEKVNKTENNKEFWEMMSSSKSKH